MSVLVNLCSGGAGFLVDYIFGDVPEKLTTPPIGFVPQFGKKDITKKDYESILLKGTYYTFFKDFIEGNVTDGYIDGHLPVVYYAICEFDNFN